MHGNERVDSLLFWSRDGKLDFSNPTPVPTLGGALSGAVADVNRNGRPDIVSANYHGGDSRLLDAQVLWNDGSRRFTRANSLILPAFSAAAAQSMDYDRDGFMDLLIFNHSEPTEVFPGLPRGGRHSVGARLDWGGPDGSQAAWQELPLAAHSGDTLRFGPVSLAPGGQFQYRLVLDSALLGTFPVVEEVTGIVAGPTEGAKR